MAVLISGLLPCSDGALHARGADVERLRLDANVPFYGTYRDDQRQAQRAGIAVAPPQLQ